MVICGRFGPELHAETPLSVRYNREPFACMTFTLGYCENRLRSRGRDSDGLGTGRCRPDSLIQVIHQRIDRVIGKPVENTSVFE